MRADLIAGGQFSTQDIGRSHVADLGNVDDRLLSQNRILSDDLHPRVTAPAAPKMRQEIVGPELVFENRTTKSHARTMAYRSN